MENREGNDISDLNWENLSQSVNTHAQPDLNLHNISHFLRQTKQTHLVVIVILKSRIFVLF